MPGQPPVVAIINTTPDVVDLLRITLERAGMVVVSVMTHEIRDGVVNLEAFVTQHQPKVIVYDIAAPYEPNWNLFRHVRQLPYMAHRFFVLTSTNSRHVEQLVGPDYQVYEVVGKPIDLDQIVQAVREALKARPTRH
jgi:CheY-like chemotaxis protein